MIGMDAQNIIFNEAHTFFAWQDKPIDDLIPQIYDLMKWGPTSANCCPARFIFLKSAAAREKLKPCLDAGNVDKTMTAPMTVIVAYDMEFYENLPRLFPHTDARSWFAGKPTEIIHTDAFRNGTLQGAYFIIAARALGLACGPMSGFNNQKVDTLFFKDTPLKSNFLINLGYPQDKKYYPRNPRLSFGEACKIL